MDIVLASGTHPFLWVRTNLAARLARVRYRRMQLPALAPPRKLRWYPAEKKSFSILIGARGQGDLEAPNVVVDLKRPRGVNN